MRPFRDEIGRREASDAARTAEESERAKTRVTAEAAARIMADAGLTPDTLAAVRRFPRAPSMDQAKQMVEEVNAPPPRREMTDAERAALEEARHNNAAIRECRQRAADRAAAEAHQAKFGVGL